MRVQAQFKKEHDDAVIPTYGSSRAAGFDFYSTERSIILPGERKLISTGLSLEMLPPKGYLSELQVRPRSGMALKHGVTVLNAPGTVDEDYRGIIGIILLNTSREAFTVEVGDRIAQGVVTILPEYVEISEADELSETERGAGGFGSTGKDDTGKKGVDRTLQRAITL